MPVAKANHRHIALADLMVCYPRLKKGQLAEMLGYTQAWLSQVIQSDAFKEVYADRLSRHQQMQSGEVIGQVQEVAKLSLGAMADKITKQGDQLPMSDLRENAAMALNALGFTGNTGGSQQEAAQVNINIGASVSVIEKARARHQQRNTKTLIEHEEASVSMDSRNGEGGNAVAGPPSPLGPPNLPPSIDIADSGPNGRDNAPDLFDGLFGQDPVETPTMKRERDS